MNGFLSDLMAHAEWANAVFFEAWPILPPGTSRKCGARVGHIIGVQQGFLSRTRAERIPAFHRLAPPSFDEIKNRAMATHAGLRDFTAAIDAAGLSKTVRVPWFPDPPCIITIAEGSCRWPCTLSITAGNA